MHLEIPLYSISVAILANIMPKLDFHAYETRIYTLRCHFPSLFDTFDTFDTFKWCIMSSYKSIAMIKVTKLKSYAMQSLIKNWLYPQTNETSLTSWRQPFCNAFWHGNQARSHTRKDVFDDEHSTVKRKVKQEKICLIDGGVLYGS